MRSLYKYPILIANLLVLIVACQGKTSVISESECKEYYKEATSNLNSYYTDSDQTKLAVSLANVEKAYGVCPDFKTRLTNLKITLLLLMKEYERGYKFVDSLNVADFSHLYKKNLYLKTFKALSFEQQGDTIKRNNQFKEIVIEIEKYISSNQSDKDAISDLFYTKLKFQEKIKVIEELNLLQSKRSDDKEFFEALKEAIEAVPISHK